MIIGICYLDVIIHGNHSLKEKRKVLKGVFDRTKSRFNISIAEVGDNDLWQRAKIGFTVVGNEKNYIDSVIKGVVDYIEQMRALEIISCHSDIWSFKP